MRLNAVLDEMAGGLSNSWLELPERSAVDRAFLEFDATLQGIRLVVYPADTLTQAKAFYLRTGALSRVLSLASSGWSIEPNFHFGHMAKGFVWTTTEAPLDRYTAYWEKNIAGTSSIPREEWEQFWSTLVKQQFARPDDKEEFDLRFTNTNRSSATPRPGLKCAYSWTLSEARVLDDKGLFLPDVARKLDVVLGAIGERQFHSPHPKP
jgi:hypothetical protein